MGNLNNAGLFSCDQPLMMTQMAHFEPYDDAIKELTKELKLIQQQIRKDNSSLWLKQQNADLQRQARAYYEDEVGTSNSNMRMIDEFRRVREVIDLDEYNNIYRTISEAKLKKEKEDREEQERIERAREEEGQRHLDIVNKAKAEKTLAQARTDMYLSPSIPTDIDPDGRGSFLRSWLKWAEEEATLDQLDSYRLRQEETLSRKELEELDSIEAWKRLRLIAYLMLPSLVIWLGVPIGMSLWFAIIPMAVSLTSMVASLNTTNIKHKKILYRCF